MTLRVENLCYSYTKNKAVLDNISFSAQSGQCTAILGVNGAGKSTLMKCIGKILIPHSGEVFYNQTKLFCEKRKDFAKKVAYVPQKISFANTTVFETVLNGRYPYITSSETPKDLLIVQKLLDKLGISDISFKKTSQLSGGELQKVALARALAQQPEILLLDEPFANLDLKSQYETSVFLKKTAENNNIAVLFTVHDVNLALRLAENFVILKNNRVFACGQSNIITPQVIFEIYGLECDLHNHGTQTIITLRERTE